MYLRAITFVAASALLVLTSASAGQLEWRSANGPTGAFVQAYDTINGVTYAGTRGGLYRSTTDGADWEKVPGVAGTAFITAVGGLGDTHLATDARARLWRSTDNGQNWSEWFNPSFGQGLAIETDGTRIFVIAADFEYQPGQFGGTIYYTDDDGESWNPILLDFPVFDFYAEPSLMLVTVRTGGFQRAILRSVDGGESFITVGDTAESTQAPQSFFNINDFTRLGGVLFCNAQGQGVYRSFDEGLNWEPCPGMGGMQDQELAAFGDAVYVSGFAHSAAPGSDSGSGVWRSDDDGATFNRADAGLGQIALNFAQDMHSTDTGILVGGQWGSYRTTDGANWQKSEQGLRSLPIYQTGASEDWIIATYSNGVLHRRAVVGGAWQSVTIPDQAYRIWADTDGTFFAGTQVAGIFRSTDAGASWQAVNTGVPTYNGTAGEQYREIGGFARKDNIIFAVTEIGLEVFGGSQGPQFSGGGVLRSLDGGLTWSTVNGDYPVIAFNGFLEPVYDPALAVFATEDAVFVSAFFNGVLRTTNNGFTWDESGAGIPDGSTVLNFAELDGVLFACCDVGGVFRSDDGGASWQSTTLPAPTHVDDIEAFNGKLYAAVGGNDFLQNGYDGVWSYEPELDFWQQEPEPVAGVGVRQLSVGGGKLFAGTAGTGVYELSAPAPAACPSDPDGTLCDSDIAGGDCMVDFADLGAMLAAYLSVEGDSNYNPAADLSPVGAPDGVVDNDDLGELLADYLNDCN